MRDEARVGIASELNPFFDVTEVGALLRAYDITLQYPQLATGATQGAVLKLTDPGTVPTESDLAFVIAYLNTLRLSFIAAGMLEEGAGGSS